MSASAARFLIAGAVSALTFGLMPEAEAAEQVDVELVLAVDVSLSMSPDELEIQRRGYATALTDEAVLRAIADGIHGKIAITYVEWAGTNSQVVVVPWTLVANRADAEHVVARLTARPPNSARRTSISAALEFGADLFAESGFDGTKRVIDISGDGPNNNGELVTVARDAALAKGITINGLPIMSKETNYATMDIENLDWYYEDCVIGGAGSFVVPIKTKEKFKEAIRTKLILEVAHRVPEMRVVPAATREPRVSCTIGEKIWQERWGR